MSTTHIIQSALEVVVGIGIIVALFYEPVIAEWERKQGEKMLKAFNDRKRYRK